jgi:hypothetical protein
MEFYVKLFSTDKECDGETGIPYCGARSLDSKGARWLSVDPAVGEYIPVATVSEEAKKKNKKLPITAAL